MCEFRTTDAFELENQLRAFKANDVFLTVRKADTSVKEIPGGPILAEVNAMEFDSDADHIRKASEERCLALSYFDGERKRSVPFDVNGQTAFLQRIGLDCAMLTGTKSASRHGLLSEEKKEEIINKVLPLWTDKVIVLIREGMARYAGSEASAFEDMQQIDLYENLMEGFADSHPYLCMVSASGNNSETEILFNLQDDDLDEKLTIALGEEARAYVRYATSDVGLRAASLFPFAKTDDGEIPIGPALEVHHKKPNTAATMRELPLRLSASFMDCENRLREMAGTSIGYPRGCFNAVARNLIAKAGLSKQQARTRADEMADRFPIGCTALDVYRMLAAAIRQDALARGLSQDKVLTLNEALARTTFVSYSEFDHLCEL